MPGRVQWLLYKLRAPCGVQHTYIVGVDHDHGVAMPVPGMADGTSNLLSLSPARREAVFSLDSAGVIDWSQGIQVNTGVRERLVHRGSGHLDTLDRCHCYVVVTAAEAVVEVKLDLVRRIPRTVMGLGVRSVTAKRAHAAKKHGVPSHVRAGFFFPPADCPCCRTGIPRSDENIATMSIFGSLSFPYHEPRDGFWGEKTVTLNFCEEVCHEQPGCTLPTWRLSG